MRSSLNLLSNEANSLLILPSEMVRAGENIPRTRRRFAEGYRRIRFNSVPLRPYETAEVANPLFLMEMSRNRAVAFQISNSAKDDAWAVLESMMGTFEGPSDWSSELDHYLYGNPKRSE